MTNKNKKKSITLKVIGGGLLLISFIVQNFVYDYWDKKSEELVSSSRDFSDMSRTSLLYLNLYFNTRLDNDTLESIVKQQYINAAAQKQALGQTVSIITRDMDKKAIAKLSNSITDKAKTVTDYNSYLNFLSFIKQTDPYDPRVTINRIDKINNIRICSRWIFLVSYIIGSFILILGIRHE